MTGNKSLQVGDKAPDFLLQNQDGVKVRLSDFRGQWVVLYFYPKDNTPGCTREAIDFTQHLRELENLGAKVLGVSPDSPESHCRFQRKHFLKVTLLSDPDHQVLSAYGAWRPKKLYGREFFGVIRSTFLIDPEQRIAHIWMPVNVKGHADDVLQTLRNLAEASPRQ